MNNETENSNFELLKILGRNIKKASSWSVLKIKDFGTILRNLRKIYPWFIQQIKNFGITGRLVWLIIPPLIFTWLMFDPFLQIELKSNTNEIQYIPQSEINENLTNFVIANFFQTSLRLGWYQVCFENLGALSINRQPVFGREDIGNIQMQVKELLDSPFEKEYNILSAKPGNTDCIRISGNTNGIVVGTSTVSTGTAGDSFPGAIMIGDNEFIIEFGISFWKMHLYIRQDLSAFVAKYLVLFFLWGSSTLLIRNLIKFVFQKNKSCKHP